MYRTLKATTVSVRGEDGVDVEAYLATPEAVVTVGGIVVIHHLPGYDRATTEIVRRFADLGYNALCPNLYSRQAPGADPSDAAAVVRAMGGIADEQLVGDARASGNYLRSLATANGKVAVIGYCSGGRQALLAASSGAFDAAIDCYGGFVTRRPPTGHVLKNIGEITSQVSRLRCPVLGLFGNADTSPSQDDVNDLESLLIASGTPHEFHRYDDAGHAFFAVDRPSYRVLAANDGWGRIEAFLSSHIGA